MHRFRQLEPSWFRSGQTTSLLLESVREKDEVKDDRGGILTPPCARAGQRRDKGDKTGKSQTRRRLRATTSMERAGGREQGDELRRRQLDGALAFQVGVVVER